MRLLPKKSKVFFMFLLSLVFLLTAKEAWAISASGSWSAYDETVKQNQTGTASISFPAKGGVVNGSFSGGFSDLFTYGGRISGNFTGGWSGTFSGSFSGWYSMKNVIKIKPEDPDRINGNIGGPFYGTLRSDGRVVAGFQNQARFGLNGDVTLYYSVEAFTNEFGSPPPGQTTPQPSAPPQPSPSISPSASPSPSPSPSPEPREIIILDLNGNPIKEATVKIRLKDGKIVDGEIKDGKINFDKSQVERILVEDEEGRSLSISHDSLDKESLVFAKLEDWQKDIKAKLGNLAKILNNGQEVNLDDYFKINWDSDENAYQPPILDFLRRFGVKDTINFSSEYIRINADVNTPVHEALGHGLTEVVGEGNKMEYAGGPHDDPWQPTYKERSKFNPLGWFGSKTVAVADERARGFALSEGWAQYVGDKWDRELTGTSDETSEYNVETAKEKISSGKSGTYGKLYADESGYGAKVENVVATAFNEIYKGQNLEKAVSDFAQVREAYKKEHKGKSFQNVNEFLIQKLKMAQDEGEKERIGNLIKELELE